jgi:hypothetical protein
MTVTARDLIGITTFGYRVSSPIHNLEAVARVTDER